MPEKRLNAAIRTGSPAVYEELSCILICPKLPDTTDRPEEDKEHSKMTNLIKRGVMKLQHFSDMI
jgi:hypothetical protein